MSVVVQKMSDADAQYIIDHQDVSAEMRNTSHYVACIATQSWCHQWHAMRAYFDSDKDVVVWYYEYDLTDLFDPFREFKEQIWKNDQIPYIRYYRAGALVYESNYCLEKDFYDHFDS